MALHEAVPRPAALRERVTVTLTPESLAWADRKSQEQGISRSELIDRLLLDAERRETAELMAEGYRAMAAENRALAEEAMESFHEALAHDSPWPNAPERNDGTR
ncbi:MAG TPA: hypothetical protein VFZ25_08130 [Chloroflexota bacterium]|nr:hypothetical protein [Chloroflexota bacterium]